ncbi:hypothetical protein HHK36_025376 [Tetracentron sinense]|uniref:NPK1-activating kinesin-like protein C-terminal domain-containing protein n=1 Tax=Tetracentron sinense TaxID=13715 RepID=A0A835D3I0_TETSI|nr:hypothetical protein HHK36_025376 [Tetracentron sinense]
MEESFAKHLEVSARLASCDDKVSPCNYQNDKVLDTPETNAMVMSEGNVNMLPDVETDMLQLEDHEKDETCTHYSFMKPSDTLVGSLPQNISAGACFENTFRRSHLPEITVTIIWQILGVTCSIHNYMTVGNQTARIKMKRWNCIPTQKGSPRIAKVVQRMNSNIEPLEYGVLLSGKLWCNSQAIFLKGFRSRVRCWEMVRERVNQEIMKQHKLGRIKPPPLEPPGSLDGLEMFGFSSPTIVQGIKAMDRNRDQGGPNDQEASADTENCPSANGVNTILTGLFKKANPEELHLLYSILSNDKPGIDRGLVSRLLNKAIQNFPRVEEGALPCLEKLMLVSCPMLKMILDGLWQLTTVEQFVLYGMPYQFRASVHRDGRGFILIPSIVARQHMLRGTFGQGPEWLVSLLHELVVKGNEMLLGAEGLEETNLSAHEKPLEAYHPILKLGANEASGYNLDNNDDVSGLHEAPVSWNVTFPDQRQQIIELWDACYVSVIHRTQFYLLFKGDPTDIYIYIYIYMEVELCRLTWLQQHLAEPGNARLAHLGDVPTISLYSRSNEKLSLSLLSYLFDMSIFHSFSLSNIVGYLNNAEVVAKLLGFCRGSNVSKEMFELNFALPAYKRTWNMGWNPISNLLHL